MVATLLTIGDYYDLDISGDGEDGRAKRFTQDRSLYSYESFCDACHGMMPDGFYLHKGMKFCPWCGVEFTDSTNVEDTGTTHPFFVEENLRRQNERQKREDEAAEKARAFDPPEGFEQREGFDGLAPGTPLFVVCGGRGPSNEGDPYGLHLAMSWVWHGTFDHTDLEEEEETGGSLYLNDAHSPHFRMTDKTTGEAVNVNEVGLPLNLIGAIWVSPASGSPS